VEDDTFFAVNPTEDFVRSGSQDENDFLRSRTQAVMRRRSWPSIFERCDVCNDLFMPLYWKTYQDLKPRLDVPPGLDERVMTLKPFDESRKMIITRQISLRDMCDRFFNGCPTCELIVQTMFSFHKQNPGLVYTNLELPFNIHFSEDPPLLMDLIDDKNKSKRRLRLHQVEGMCFQMERICLKWIGRILNVRNSTHITN
jgi:hypothetical protein